MINSFAPMLFPEFEHQCFWCDELIPGSAYPISARLDPGSPPGGGISVSLYFDICRSCLDRLAEDAIDVGKRLDHERGAHEETK